MFWAERVRRLVAVIVQHVGDEEPLLQYELAAGQVAEKRAAWFHQVTLWLKCVPAANTFPGLPSSGPEVAEPWMVRALMPSQKAMFA